MNIDELKQAIEQRTGLPASLLSGETAEENIAQAKALLAYKREQEQQKKTPAERFGEFFSAQIGEADPQDATAAALADIEEAARVEAGGYPILSDGGCVTEIDLPDGRPARDQFAEWAREVMAWRPSDD